MNKFFLASGIFSLLFVVYIWIFYLPFYENAEIYDGVRTVVTVVSIVLVINAIMTTYLALRPSLEEKGP